MTNSLRSITLYSQEGSSDKVYVLQVNPVDGGFGVFYANGRRGSSLKIKAKTTTPLTEEAAIAEFDKIVKSKKRSSSRYTESPDGGQTLEISEKASQDSGIRVQLLNEITEEQAVALCHDPLFVCQEKYDGERRPVIIKSGQVNGTNRYGEFTGGMKSVVKEGISTAINMVLDTEDLDDHLVAFDLLEYDGVDIRNLSYSERYSMLVNAVSSHKSIDVAPLAQSTEQKLALLARVREENREGVVFKRADAPYVSGKPSKLGDQLKFKLYDEVSVLVHKINTQRSVQMAMIDTNGDHVLVGNVTIPQNATIPSVGDVIEVRYLYAYRDGCIYQPIFEKARPDLRPNECKLAQLKYKRDASRDTRIHAFDIEEPNDHPTGFFEKKEIVKGVGFSF